MGESSASNPSPTRRLRARPPGCRHRFLGPRPTVKHAGLAPQPARLHGATVRTSRRVGLVRICRGKNPFRPAPACVRRWQSRTPSTWSSTTAAGSRRPVRSGRLISTDWALRCAREPRCRYRVDRSGGRRWRCLRLGPGARLITASIARITTIAAAVRTASRVCRAVACRDGAAGAPA
jgi:hypothetical protein